MKLNKITIKGLLLTALVFSATACNDILDTLPENRNLGGQADYTISANMILPLIGAYAEFTNRGWEDIPLISVRGDDVNAGGLGDQQPYADTDMYKYDQNYWMYNSVWRNLYGDIMNVNSAIEQITNYKEFAPNPALADQYIAECQVLRAYLLFNIARVWGNVYILEESTSEVLFKTELSTQDEVMQYISDQMEAAQGLLPAIRPNERTDIPGGVTKFTALAVKALAELELNDFQGVADATGPIISSNKFTLESDFYELFKLQGKLNDENILELQYSDFGGVGSPISYLFAFFGPENWTPKVAGAGSGWGFYEPSMKWIKFMLDRGEQERLQTSVLFTDRGITAIKADPEYAALPGWISNTTPSGDLIKDYGRAMFASGKQYLPSDELTAGKTDYGTNKNFPLIRYAEILLMHAEALTQGATSSAMTADQAVNAVRARAGLNSLAGVTLDQVLDEKYAELAMELGSRYFDMVRYGRTSELSYDGRTFTEDKTFLPYPQEQIDKLPALGAPL
jgi:starch-binding outer membrane protein, SusD/RagB family